MASEIKSLHKGGAKLAYLPGLDGLRAIAVAAVVLYHADEPWIPGGYLGVEVFFVLSGYLITSLLLSEWRKTGKINLGQFWLRRARRLLPALFLLLAATSIFAVIFLPDEIARLRGDTLAASGYVTNWYLAFSQQSYFQFVGRPSMLQHLWSLAVEEQFYLLWPLLFVAGCALLKRVRRYHLVMLIATLTGAAASTALMFALYNPDADPSRIYYGTDTRAAALLIGCALAFASSWVKATDRREGADPNSALGNLKSLGLDLLGIAALGGLGYIMANLDVSQPLLYQGGLTVTALVTAAIIAVVAHPRARIVPGLLGWGFMRWIGMRSYGIYLWHWPIFQVTRPQLDIALDGAPLLALRLGLTLALAGLSYRYIETPVREGSIGRYVQKWREARGVQRTRLGTRLAIATVLSLLLAGALGTALVSAKPPATPDYLLELEANATALPRDAAETPLAVDTAVAGNLDTPGPSVQDPLATGTAPGEVSPEPAPPGETATAASTVVIPGLPACSIDATVTQTPTPALPLSPSSGAVAAASVSVLTPTPTPTPTSAVPRTPTAVPPKPLSTSTPSTAKFLGRVLAVGDSVMLSGAAELKKAIPNIEIDAVVSRQLVAGIAALKARRDAGTLSDIVVIHLGSNGTFSARNFDQIMEILGTTRRVIFINDKAPRPWERTNNAAIAAGVQRYPNTAMVDWRAASINRPELFAKDGIHMQTAGARLYTQLLVDALNQ